MTSGYQYEPLPNDGIRLLQLSPGPPGSPLYCHLRLTSLKASRRKFDAISYTWGDLTSRNTILCGERHDELKVTDHCHNALLHLRHADTPQTIWIDAICINQANTTEKTSQVKIMGKIYAAARRTVIFLGNESEDSKTVCQDKSDPSKRLPSTNIAHATERLFERPWFTRIWGVQEFGRGNDPVFMCGNSEIPYDALSLARPFVKNFPTALEIKHGLFRSSFENYCTTGAQKLFLLVAETGLRQSTEPLDRILALIPLVEIRRTPLEGLINYSQTLRELFYRFTIALINGKCALVFLNLIRRPHHIDGLPSWVPNWTEPRDNSGVINKLFRFFRDQYEAYKVQEDIRVIETNADFALHRLMSKGHPYGIIDEQGPSIRMRMENANDRKEDVLTLVNLIKSISSGTDVDASDWPASVKDAIRGISSADICDLLRSHLLERELSNETVDGPASYEVAIGCDGTKFFVTSEGKLGVCPEAAQKGDLVCILRGTLEPCILRGTRSDWLFVSGQCVLLEFERAVPGFDGIWEYMEVEQLGGNNAIKDYIIC
ncbi:heterokaryon incompatibility protein-domain-containing protein [Xylaria sp. FL0933]|nr:heterokaryon incompatibility protein-domain-containing protein [Xylaria sp. FL0933]